jgi:flagellar biosynthesis protein FliP
LPTLAYPAEKRRKAVRGPDRVGGARGAKSGRRKGRAIVFLCGAYIRNPSCFFIRTAAAAVVVFLLFSALSAGAQGQEGPGIPLPALDVGLRPAQSTEDVALTLQVLFLLTILSIAPGILIMTTAFTRIIIVLSFLRRALGTQETPSTQVLAGLALFLTFFIMTPTWQRIHEEAIRPYLNEQIEPEVRIRMQEGQEVEETIQPFQIAVERALVPMRDFMWQQLSIGDGASDVALFMNLGNYEKPETRHDVPTSVLIPAFIISELKKAFILGFLIFLPFLIIDLVTASVLMSMGMMMLPPILISLPFKVLLFILVDGWQLLIMNLGQSFIPG